MYESLTLPCILKQIDGNFKYMKRVFMIFMIFYITHYTCSINISILNLSWYAMFVSRGKAMFGFADRELATKSGYDLIHPDDLNYFSSAHQECKHETIKHP